MELRAMSADERNAMLRKVCGFLGETTPLEHWAREMDAADAASETGRPDSAMTCIREVVPPEVLHGLVEAVRPVLAYEPDLTLLGDKDAVYMRRWWLTRQLARDGSGGERGQYVHGFWNDDPAGLHDHPWPSASLLLAGRVRDHTESGRWIDVSAGDVVLRPAGYRHRLTLHPEANRNGPHAMSLIATGRRRPGGWEIVHADGTREHIGKGNTDGRPQTFSRS